MHRLDFPVLLAKLHQLFSAGISAGNVIAGLPAELSTGLNTPFNGKNRPQTRLLMLVQPGNILDFPPNPLFDPPCIFLCRLADFTRILVARVLKKQADIRQ